MGEKIILDSKYPLIPDKNWKQHYKHLINVPIAKLLNSTYLCIIIISIEAGADCVFRRTMLNNLLINSTRALNLLFWSETCIDTRDWHLIFKAVIRLAS